MLGGRDPTWCRGRRAREAPEPPIEACYSPVTVIAPNCHLGAGQPMLHAMRDTVRHRALQVRTRADRGLAALPRFVQGFRYGRALAAAPPPPPQVFAEADNPLRRYFESHASGDGITKWSHYFDIYHRHFAKFAGTPVNILEVGVYSGGSLQMWRDYFGEGCTVYGVDIEPSCRAYAGDGVEIFIGDQADPRFWQRILREVPALDIVVDDGGHETEQQVVTLEALLPHLRPGGVYLCEDVTDFGNPFHAYIAGLAENLHDRTPISPGVMGPNGLQQLIEAIHIYPYVTVIERTTGPRPPFVSDRRGTQWQQFTSGRM